MEMMEVLQSTRWSSILLGGLKDLYATSQLFDVELVENSGRSLWAHSCVLAAACPLMKSAFMTNQAPQQTARRIFYADINIERWKQLLDFIYLGQVSVPHGQLPQLLTTASNLGLTELETVCREVLEQHTASIREHQIVSVTPRKQQQHQPRSSQSLSTKKRNMLERIPPAQQVPIILNIEEGSGAGDGTDKKVVVKREEDEDGEEMGGMGDENAGPDAVGSQVENGTYRCTKCNKDLPYGTSLFRHELRHKMFPKKKKKDGKFECSKCPKRFMNKNARNCHERNHNKEPKFKCNHCEQAFFFEFVRDKHVVKDHPELEPELAASTIPCDVDNCNKTFPTVAILRMHRARKHGIKDETARPDKPVPCDLCGKEVLWLNEHKKSVHPEEMGEERADHECPECGKVMKYASSLKRHMYVHQDGGGVNCPHCNKQFNHPSSMWSHIPACPKIPPEEKILLKSATPSSTKKYKRKPKELKCEVCQKSFTNLRNYRNHVDNHLGKYKHICGHCGKKFQNSNHYSDHMNRHYGIKPYECPTCGHTFASKSDMKQHIRQHTGERPFQCPICNREFVHRSNCYAHARKAHQKELSADPELARLCKVSNRHAKMNMEILQQDDEPGNVTHIPQEEEVETTTIMVVDTGEGDKELLENTQETVQIAELLLSQHEKGNGAAQQLQTLGGQTYTTIQTDSATGALNTVLVPQYNIMYSSQAGTNNIYTTTVANANDFTQQQQQQGGQQPEMKFCLYDG